MSNKPNTIDVPDKEQNQQRDSIVIEDASNAKIADFETAITVAGTGKFQHLLIFAIIPASWASSIDTANMSMILPSAECDLGLSLFDKGLLNAIIYVGMLLSGFIWGYFADVKGRKKILIYGYMADGICNVLSGFSQNFETLLFFKFLSGLLVCGPYAALMAYSAEFYGTKGRTKIPILVGFSVSFGCVVNAALGWLVIPQPWSIVLWDGAFVYNSWRMFLSLCGVSSLIGVCCLSFFPESPKFLMTQNRNKDALEVFKKIYSMNTGLPKDNYPICALNDVNLNRILNTLRLWQPQLFATINDFYSLNTNITEPTFCEILDISRSINANKTVALESSTCENIVVSNSMYIDSIIVSATSSIFILCASIAVNFLQHKYLLFIGYGCSILCLIALIWSTSSLSTLILTCLYVGIMSKSFYVLVGATVLLFPTALRTMAVSIEMLTGRLGSITGNLIFPVLLEYGCIAPIINLICFTSLCLLLTYFLPSTNKHAT
ncbi:PREDICTED: synaptic vesicle glycoprotein 2C-like [Cyphomyrmex costatus]|uniref:synaptic vesicle glycoprotein 2C-like n=1 Tax=Cyphomyrmex costatus TaxID=456900 RepID=UPI0008522867|nr:PREDICTED: synaptic vesicle glycoprotein 2C-like [Cyphomyrmex costatus]